MDQAKRDFLYGPDGCPLPDGDLDDVQLEPGGGDWYGRRLEVGRRLVSMIEHGDPPEVWETARRLLGGGLDRRDVLAQLRLVVRRRVLDIPERLDDAGLVASLTALPVPAVGEMTDAYLTAAAARPGAVIDDVEQAVREHFGRATGPEAGSDPFEWLLELVGEMPMEEDSPLEWLSGDRIVHVASLTDGIVLTHRLTEWERDEGVLAAGFDLAGFRRRPALHLAGGRPIEVFDTGDGDDVDCWVGPEGWLEGFSAGDPLAVTVAGNGLVTVEPCAEPATDPELATRIRAIYDREVDETWLPMSAEELILGLLVEDRATFVAPQTPMCELVEAVGLERRGMSVAHDVSVWREDDSFRRFHRFCDELGEERAVLASRVFDSIYGEAEYRCDDGPQGDEAARLALADPELAAVALDEAVPVDDPVADDLAAATEWADELIGLARSPSERAVAHWLAALVMERAADPLTAAAHLELALEADPDFGPAVDRAAWYASDRGDAALAARLWRRLEQPRIGELEEVESAAQLSSRTPGRNEPCWCGSGRKYKACHLPEPAAIPMPERVGWLCRKAVSYVERRGGEAMDDVMQAIVARAVDPADPENLEDALADPIVFDAVLTEGGWFEQFLTDRGPLLPDDEALLGTAWLQVPRTVYEVESVRPGEGMTVRDLRSAETIDVRERSFSRTAQPAQRFCGRAVPDGTGHQFIGAVFPVKVGHEAALLDLCDDGDPFELCHWVGDLHRPPVVATREGEPLVECRAVVEIPDPETLAEVLDVRYEPVAGTPNAWAEMHELAPGDHILRAVLTLDRSSHRLTVETHSEDRLDRVLATLEGAGWDIDIIEESRRPLDPDEMPRPPQALPAGGATDFGIDPAVVAQVQDEMEQRWLDESVPALGGASPRQAANDPTRRDDLIRLIDTFPEPEPGTVFFSFRPDRLRKLLGLPRR